MKTKQILAATLAAVSLFSMAAPALADEGHGNGDGEHQQQGQGRGHNKHQKQNRFQDLEDSSWAQLNIEKAYQLGLMMGEGEGHFNPHASLRREEAIVTAIRLMGLDAQAKAQAGADLHFTDASHLDSWATGAVAVAVDKNILPPSGDGELRPQEAASRLWVSVLLVKALGYDAEAQSKMNAQLTFEDASQIPANLVGYVAAAVDHKLVAGYDDNTFKPNKPVTRAEMAALLGRSNTQLDDQGKAQGETHGIVKTVDVAAGTLTVQGPKGTISASLKADASIFVDGKPADLSAVTVGMQVWVKLDDQMEITLVDATSGQPGGGTTNPDGQTVTGTVTTTIAASGNVLGSLSVKTADGTTVTAVVAPLAKISYNSQTLALTDLKAGDTVQVTEVAGIIVAINVTSRATIQPQASTVTGTVTAFMAPQGTVAGSLYLQQDNNAGLALFTIVANTPVVLGTTAKTFADVTVNSHVKLTLQNSTVTQIQLGQ